MGEQLYRRCEDCRGEGWHEPVNAPYRCPTCAGRGYLPVPAPALPDAATVAAVRNAIAACDEQAARRALLADDFGMNPDGADAAEQAASEAQMARDAAATLRTFLAAQEGTDDGNG